MIPTWGSSKEKKREDIRSLLKALPIFFLPRDCSSMFSVYKARSYDLTPYSNLTWGSPFLKEWRDVLCSFCSLPYKSAQLWGPGLGNCPKEKPTLRSLRPRLSGQHSACHCRTSLDLYSHRIHTHRFEWTSPRCTLWKETVFSKKHRGSVETPG